MLIRRASSEDYRRIHDLMDDLVSTRMPSDKHRSHGRIHAYPQITSNSLDSDLYVVAIKDGEAIGFAHGSLYDTHRYRLKQLGYIEELFIREEYRGKWLAKELFLALEDEFAKLDTVTHHLE